MTKSPRDFLVDEAELEIYDEMRTWCLQVNNQVHYAEAITFLITKIAALQKRVRELEGVQEHQEMLNREQRERE